MSKSKTQVSVKVHQDVKEGMDDYADEQNLNRSQTVEEIYHQWGTLTNYGENHPDLITERLATDPLDERPDSTLAGWLWRARQDIHTFVLVALVGLLVSTMTGSAVIWFGAQLLAVSYSLAVLLVAVDTVLLRDRITLRLMDISDRVTVEVDT